MRLQPIQSGTMEIAGRRPRSLWHRSGNAWRARSQQAEYLHSATTLRKRQAARSLPRREFVVTVHPANVTCLFPCRMGRGETRSLFTRFAETHHRPTRAVLMGFAKKARKERAFFARPILRFTFSQHPQTPP